MALNSDFCREIMGCDQPRTRSSSDCFTCNITHEPLNGMNLWDCPEVKKVLAEHRTIGRQDALAELDRSAGQPPQTYVQKQSLMNLLARIGCSYHDEERIAATAQDRTKEVKRSAQVAAISKLLKGIVAGTPSLKEVEL